MSQQDFVDAIRRVLNETRQDRVCRDYLGESKVLVPFLGSEKPYYLFLGAGPVGYDLEAVPEGSDDYLEFAQSYFSRNDRDKAPFVHFLPFTANLSEDYQIFGEAASVVNISPIPVEKSSQITPDLLASCWARARTLITLLRPKVVMCHGSTAWKFLAGLENGSQPQLISIPASHKVPLAQLYKKTVGSDLPFRSKLVDSDSGFEPIFLPLPSLGKSAPSKLSKEAGEEGLAKARRMLRGKATGLRIRVRKAST
jgi:hypothetical protein